MIISHDFIFSSAIEIKLGHSNSICRNEPILEKPTKLDLQNSVNRILAHVRPGGGRSTAMFNQVCEEVTTAWNRIVEPGPSGERELRAIFILGTIIAGSEAGFILPPVRSQYSYFEKLVVEILIIDCR